MTGRTPIVGWLTAIGISSVGTRVSMIAVPWFVLTTTDSAVKTGLVALAELLPMVVIKVLGGPTIDRIGPRRVAVSCDLASMVVIGTIPLLHGLGLLEFPVLLGLVALGGALRGPGDSAKDATIPLIVEHAGVPMERATGLESAVVRGASMVGSAFGGGLVAVLGPVNAIVVDAASFGLAAVVFGLSTASLPRRATGAEEAEEASYVEQLRSGWRFLRGDRLLFSLAVMIALVNMLDVAFMTVLLPVWADAYAGPALVGAVFAVWNLFSVVGSLCAARWGERLPRYPIFVVGFLLGGIPRYLAFAFDTPIWLILVAAVIGGLALGFAHPIVGAVEFERIPQQLVGRVLTLMSAMAMALMPLSGVLGGGLVSAVGLTATMLGLGAAYVVVTLVPALDPLWRGIDASRPVPAPRRPPRHPGPRRISRAKATRGGKHRA